MMTSISPIDMIYLPLQVLNLALKSHARMDLPSLPASPQVREANVKSKLH